MRYNHLGDPFNKTFSHQNARINGLNIHYVIGGTGEPLVLLHGYPQTWYAFRHIMPVLAKNYTVIAPDLRGLGDSEKPLTGYDTYSVADDMYRLVRQLGFTSIRLLGHDFGANVAYAYTASHRGEVSKLALLDVGLLDSGIENYPMLPKQQNSLWWFPFHNVKDLPEQLVAGKEELYLRWFYENSAFNKVAFTKEDISEFVRCYSSPGGMRAGFEYYRAIALDVKQNLEQVKTKLTLPVLALGGEKSFGMAVYESWKAAAENIRGAVIPQSGHYIADEQPEALLAELLPFFR
jgi:pimeloyl-ACP methyl ester carboxylesterase